MNSEKVERTNNIIKTIKFLFCSFIGIFMFFIPIEINGQNTIAIDHIANFIKELPYYEYIYGGIVVAVGGIYPFITKSWKKDRMAILMSFLKILGLIVTFMTIFSIGPSDFLKPNMLPFIYRKILIPVTTIVPISSIFLAFIVDYGIIEFMEVLMKPIMKPIWKTPGCSAISALSSFVGGYSLGLLITNRTYIEGKYTEKEACIIGTGFVTVSVTLMIIVAKTLNIVEYWNLYFGLTIGTTLLVTALTARIYPLSNKAEIYYLEKEEKTDMNLEPKDNLFKIAWKEGIKAFDSSSSILENTIKNLKDAIKLVISIAPSLMSIGFIGLAVAKYTPFFDILGYLFYPFTLLLKIPEPFLAAKASAISIVEMLLPSIIVAEAPFMTRFIIAIVSVSEILFFSASIPCILSTKIPLTIKDIIIIWVERVILSLLIAAPVVYLIFG